MEKFYGKVAQKNQLTADVVELRVALEGGAVLDFTAGQYLELFFDYTFRSYSFVNVPGESELVFCIKLVPDGLASEYVKKLTVGERVSLRGPKGDFVLPNMNKNFLGVATSTGLAPILSIAKDALGKGYKKNMTVVFGVRSEQNLFYFKILQELSEEYGNFNFVVCLSRPSGSKFFHGRVTDFLKKHKELSLDSFCFLSGGQTMVLEAQDILLKQGASLEKVKNEIFF